ncbi:MAG: hybrid sensor histidine kinase/response regulator [Nitrospirae bacterium]|nr:hybrid sensor histidine kinase/response regulator [Nitrospirota bacterium]
MHFDSSRLVDFFLAEAYDHINILEKGILQLEANPRDIAQIEELFRSAHTIKGSAALVKLNGISNAAHRMEDILEGVMGERIPVTPQCIEVLLYILDTIKELIRGVGSGKEEPASLGEKIDYMIKTKIQEVEKPEEERRELGRRKEDKELVEHKSVRVDVSRVEEMMNLVGELTIIKNHLFKNVKKTDKLTDEVFATGVRLLRELTSFSDRYAYSLPESVKYTDTLLSDFQELEFDRYDELNLFSRKLQEITNDINEALRELAATYGDLVASLKNIDKVVGFLKGEVSEVRMIEIGKLFHRFTRPVRDIALESNKKVDFNISGGETKVDKLIFEKLFDPLLHLVRNAIYHGIEPPQERTEAGKKAEGDISLSARREGNNVVIELRDDGRGIDTEKVREVAVERGMFSVDYPQLRRQDLIDIIFTPGFTTTETTNMVSGRGIGLNVVREYISALNGLIEVDTEKGVGTTFRLKVPLSLIIVDVVSFMAGGMEFVVPARLVEEITYTGAHMDINEPDSLNFRGRRIPVKLLTDTLGFKDIATVGNKPVLVVNLAGRLAGMIVDEIVSHEETVIKPLGRFLEGLTIYSGATISGDGKVRVVINPTKLFEEKIPVSEIGAVTTAEKAYQGRRVLIVDDSLSVRKYVSGFLESKDFRVYTATNGIEALKLLGENEIDLIITDLEMPVMHGYELINELRKEEKFQNIPVVVLTSRGSEKHREKALSLGAKDYLVKPFDEDTLIEVVRRNLSASFLT